jgi:hypothetical protein
MVVSFAELLSFFHLSFHHENPFTLGHRLPSKSVRAAPAQGAGCAPAEFTLQPNSRTMIGFFGHSFWNLCCVVHIVSRNGV